MNKKRLICLVVLVILCSSTSVAFAQNEKDPRLEYIRTTYYMVTQMENAISNSTAITNNTIEVKTNALGFVGKKPVSRSDGTFSYDEVDLKKSINNMITLRDSVISFKIGAIKGSGTKITQNNGKEYMENYELSMDMTMVDQTKKAYNISETIANKIKSETSSEKEMVILANKYIVDNVDYVVNNSSEDKKLWTPYGALVEGKAVCEGYSYGFHAIMDALGIPVLNVTGIAGDNNVLHMWNKVLIDGQWLYVDTTFNDPVITGKPSQKQIEAQSKEFLLLTENAFYNKGEHQRGEAWVSDIAYNVFDRNHVEQEADILKAKGLFLGDDTGFRLADGLTRSEMAVSLTRVVGGEGDVLANKELYSDKCTFNDVSYWAKPYVGYCMEKGLIKGMTKSLYGSNNKANKLDFCTVILRATGVRDGYSYDTSDSKAVEMGYLNIGRSAFADLTRSDVVHIIYNVSKKGLI